MRILEILFAEQNEVELLVEMPDPERVTTRSCPHVPRGLFRLFPRMRGHTCHNGCGHSFRREAMATEVPHLLEHLIIELQAEALGEGEFRGETQWNWTVDRRGIFHVHIHYRNELLVLASIRLAERIISAIDAGDIDAVDVEAERERLRTIARLGATLPPPARRAEVPAQRATSTPRAIKLTPVAAR